jgi:hypothetical protein
MLLVVLGFFFYLLFTIPQTQMISSGSIYKAIQSVVKNEDPR